MLNSLAKRMLIYMCLTLFDGGGGGGGGGRCSPQSPDPLNPPLNNNNIEHLSFFPYFVQMHTNYPQGGH